MPKGLTIYHFRSRTARHQSLEECVRKCRLKNIMTTVVGVFKVDIVSLRLHLTFIKVSSKSDIFKPRTISTALITNCFAILMEPREYICDQSSFDYLSPKP
jgi:cell shape-determining protein MreD